MIIPIGTEEFRGRVTQTRSITNVNNQIPEGIHIVQDGESIRILGAWFGNKTIANAPWAPILEKVDGVLERWEKGHPTIEGRQLIIQMVVGGMTQYLTQVEGMPQHIETHLTKRIKDFIWEERKPTVRETILHEKAKRGGKRSLT